MLLDSNILIYAAQPGHERLRRFIAEHVPVVSVITYIEVLGYHHLQPTEQTLLEHFFSATEILPLSDAVAKRAVQLRRLRRMSLGDSVVAATALVHDHELVTHNTDDFRWIAELRLHDPLA